MGSKEGLANLANAITSPGDIVLVPNPSYPIHPYGFIIAGGSCRYVPVTPDSIAIRRMEAFVVGAVSLEDFMRTGGLGPYAVKSDSAGRQP